jgi:cytochrome c-type biogenesis protein CcmE
MKIPANTLRITIAAVIIVGTIGWLALSGYTAANTSYYVTVAQLSDMGEKAYHNQLRVEGFVVPGSIETNGTHVTFTLNEFESHSPKALLGRELKVVYHGSEPPPDTFKDDSQALAEGSYGRDGVFHANALQAKCASKYAPATPLHPGDAKPGAPPTKSNVSKAVQPGVPAS